MSDGVISAEIDVSDVVEGLRKLGAIPLQAVLKQLKKPLRADQTEHRKDQEGPEGKWPARSAATLEDLKRRRRARSRTTGKKRGRLRPRLLGRLPGAYDVRVDMKNLIARSRVGWSLAHYEGGRVGNDSVLPARPWLWFSDGFLDDAKLAIEAAMPGAFGP